ncbi:unnamed protein product [Ophioblennius macclurei]
MDPCWPPLLVSAAVLMAAVLLLATCVNCRNKGPLSSIHQTPSEDYVGSTNFRIIHPHRLNSDQNANSADPHLLSPFLSSADPGPPRGRPSFTTTDTDSNPSYENPGPESLEGDADKDYIIVLPDGEAPPSRASSPSSDAQHNYVNIEDDLDQNLDDSLEENLDYVNVEPASFLQAPTDEDDSDEDEEGNYVNQPTVALEELKPRPDLMLFLSEQRIPK